MISLKIGGKAGNSFKKTTEYFTKTIKILKMKEIYNVADKALERLKAATPKRSGLTADSWRYNIIRRQGNVKIHFYNINNQNGVNVALLLEYGHVSRDGVWIEGKHYIDSAIKKSYNEILNSTWKELTEL